MCVIIAYYLRLAHVLGTRREAEPTHLPICISVGRSKQRYCFYPDIATTIPYLLELLLDIFPNDSKRIRGSISISNEMGKES